MKQTSAWCSLISRHIYNISTAHAQATTPKHELQIKLNVNIIKLLTLFVNMMQAITPRDHQSAEWP